MPKFDNDFYEVYCYHVNPANHSPLLTQEQLWEYNAQAAEHEAEMYAEGAWLRHAERTTAEDMAFERWEHDRGCY